MTNLATQQPTQQPTNLPSIDALALALIDAKAEADQARTRVLEIENEIVNIFGNEAEGTTNFDGIEFTIQTVGSLTRSLVDVEKMKANLPPVVFDTIVNYKPALNVNQLKKLAVLDPASYRMAARFISEKPAKTSVKVKEQK